MRIGFLGFTQNADVIIPPPSEVSYSPAARPTQRTTFSGLAHLYHYNVQSSYTINLTWKDIPERDLALLAFIPPHETITLIDQAGKEWLVILNEPTRAMLTGVSTRDGQPLYSASLVAYPIVESKIGSTLPIPSFQTLKAGKVVVPDTLTPRDPPAPPSPTPEYSPIRARARNGLPPTVEYGEGVRFTFSVFSDEVERARYYSVDTDGYLELLYISPQLYEGWYSNVHGNRLVKSILKRFPWKIDNAWTVGAMLYIDPSLVHGQVLEACSEEGVLYVAWYENNLFISLHLSTVNYATSFIFPPQQYLYLGMQYSYGNFKAGINGQLSTVTPSATSSTTFQDRREWVLGGGPGYCDDLLVVGSDNVDLQQVYSWLVD